MTPIRVGIIGLSSTTGEASATPGDGWAASAHLPYLLASPHYQVAALCNSSEKSARVAAERYGLPSNTKAYGSATELAQDPEVDLVVSCVRVDRHYPTIKPALEAGKHVYVEWPLASNLAQAEELLAIAKKTGSKTIVGLQTRVSPQIQKIRELIRNNAIGDILSSTLSFELGFDGDVEPPGTDYLTKKEIGGNIHTILFGHAADPVFYALGGPPEELSALLTTRWPKTKFLHKDGTFDRLIDRETADHISMQGILPSSGAPISVVVRGGKVFKGNVPYQWNVLGTKGQIRVTSPPSMVLDLGSSKIELYTHESDTVEEVEVQFADSVKDLQSPMAKNIGMLYEMFATGRGDGFVDFEEAVKTHKVLEAMERSSTEKKTISVFG